MPTGHEHAAKYRDNKAFLLSNGGLVNHHPAWAAVVAFYAAVHLVEQLAARDGRHNADHRDRDVYLAGHRDHNEIQADFAALLRASKTARYLPVNRYLAAFPGTATQALLIDGCLARIEKYVAGQFAAPPSPAS